MDRGNVLLEPLDNAGLWYRYHSLFAVAMQDRPVQRTGDRWYREVINDDAGSTQVTQFVGGIPPGRAPDHFHLYEEVIVILDGVGEMWAGTSHAPIATGSCIFLPNDRVHCVENRTSARCGCLEFFIRREARRCGTR